VVPGCYEPRRTELHPPHQFGLNVLGHQAISELPRSLHPRRARHPEVQWSCESGSNNFEEGEESKLSEELVVLGDLSQGG
jgi:hypothetical protein